MRFSSFAIVIICWQLLNAMAWAGTISDAAFEAWLMQFKRRVLAEDIRPEVVESVLEGLTPDPKVIERNEYQPEFAKPVWEYLDIAVSPQRISDGKTAMTQKASAMQKIAQHYGVEREILTAIWGLESSYGAIKGKRDVPRSLATLAYQGRRASYGENELLAVMKILQSGAATRSQLKGSWAGAMGHTQFIPTNYLDFAQDWDKDGRKNLWEDEDDALASTAYYLKRHGWRSGESWGHEVRLPEDFDFRHLESGSLTIGQWAAQGVTKMAGGWSANELMSKAELILPAGAEGPAILVRKNFFVIKRYNNSTSYALGIALLADRLAGKPGLVKPWPRDAKPLNRDQIWSMQANLNKLGFSAGEPDGIIGPNTRRALRSFQRAHALKADGFASQGILDLIFKSSMMKPK